MSNRKYISFVFCLLCTSLHLAAQQRSTEDMDITGLWRGFMYNDTTQKNFRYEVAISEEKGKLFGYSHTFFIIGDKEYSGVKKLKIKRDGNEITTEDVDLIANNYPEKPPKGIHMKNVLTFTLKDTVMILSGLFTTNTTRFFSRNTGYVHVERKRDYSQSALVPHLQELGLVKNLSFLKEENNPPSDETIAVLKPMQSEEEEQLIVTAAKKQETDNNIKPATAVVKTSLPKIPEPVVVKPVVQKPAEPVVAKVAPPKTTEQPVTKKPEAVVVNKPAPPKTEAPVVKVPPVKVVETVAAPPVVAKKSEPVDPLAAIDASKRKVENIQALYFKSDSLQLILYDNGEVDGDTVSVIMNGTVIMPRVGLSTNAVKKTIDTKDAGDSIQIVMYAESLGTLPPNTGLLIVYDGKDRYEIRFSGDMQKSSGIVFRRRKE
ncbi:hypothetical protein [Ferruginibacter sp. SUN106]|uniref:hypothetical protein n=1 Tax=Ferruginibacter sp. SUN106 TaxID=2978348 RepID=UPI003D35F8AC